MSIFVGIACHFVPPLERKTRHARLIVLFNTRRIFETTKSNDHERSAYFVLQSVHTTSAGKTEFQTKPLVRSLCVLGLTDPKFILPIRSASPRDESLYASLCFHMIGSMITDLVQHVCSGCIRTIPISL